MYVVFSDLDGTLLDHHTYSYDLARDGMALLKEKGVPLVLVSSKTFEEMKGLHAELRLRSPFIFENGGGIAWKKNDLYDLEYIGQSAAELKRNSSVLTDSIGQEVRFITEMTVDEIMQFTGLSGENARMAGNREVSLPFILKDRDYGIKELEILNKELVKSGLVVTRGGRFYHLSSLKANKGNAIREVVKGLFQKNEPGSIISIGIGDSENDIPMLELVDIPFLVRKHDGTFIETGISKIKVTSKAGPSGFSEAMKSIFSQ
jgi:mannosyl-3-phosphoglycerate phosphatase